MPNAWPLADAFAPIVGPHRITFGGTFIGRSVSGIRFREQRVDELITSDEEGATPLDIMRKGSVIVATIEALEPYALLQTAAANWGANIGSVVYPGTLGVLDTKYKVLLATPFDGQTRAKTLTASRAVLIGDTELLFGGQITRAAVQFILFPVSGVCYAIS